MKYRALLAFSRDPESNGTDSFWQCYAGVPRYYTIKLYSVITYTFLRVAFIFSCSALHRWRVWLQQVQLRCLVTFNQTGGYYFYGRVYYMRGLAYDKTFAVRCYPLVGLYREWKTVLFLYEYNVTFKYRPQLLIMSMIVTSAILPRVYSEKEHREEKWDTIESRFKRILRIVELTRVHSCSDSFTTLFTWYAIDIH